MSKTIVITGGSRGIGRATAVLCAQRGWSVALQYRGNRQAAAMRWRCRAMCRATRM